MTAELRPDRTSSRPTPPSGFARLAGRIADWTTRAALTAIILVAGLGFGRQVLQWWGAEQGPVSSVPQGPPIDERLGDPLQPHDLQFGDKTWTLTQQTLEGSKHKAVESLRAACRAAAGQAQLPRESPGPAETRFLDSIASRKPIEEEAGAWQLFELNDAFPLVVGVRPGMGPEPPPAGGRVAVPGRRVVIWGIAVPKGQDQWTLYAFHSPSPASGLFGDLPEVPLPPDAWRVLSVHVAGGGTVVHFAGPEQVETWKQFYSSWFRANGWKAVANWQRRGPAWHARWEHPAGAVEVQFGPDGREGLSGLLLLSPVKPPATESKRS